jgi:hypothetical protein
VSKHPKAKQLPDLVALSSRELFYSQPEKAKELGLDPYVRAGSSAALLGSDLYVVQDDVNVLTKIDLVGGFVEPIPLQLPGPLTRDSNEKADFEACALLPDQRLLILGSGSSSPRRQALVADLKTGECEILNAQGLFDGLDTILEKMGGTTNIEGISLVGSVVHLFHRGRGASGSCNALIRLPGHAFWQTLMEGKALDLHGVRARWVHLGAIENSELGWTDGIEMYGLGLVFTAFAGDHHDTEHEPTTQGSVLGLLDNHDHLAWAQVLHPDRSPISGRLDGFALATERAWLVAEPNEKGPSQLIEVNFGTVTLGASPEIAP